MAAANAISTSKRHVALKATPFSTLMDETVSIKVSGLMAKETITLRSYIDDEGKQFESHAHYTSDDNGKVSTNDQPSEGGTYTGVEPMDLLWSMVACPNHKLGTRYMKGDVTTPLIVNITVHNGHLDDKQVREDTSPVAATTVERWYMNKNVEKIKVHTGRIRGSLLKPKGTGPFPAVIDMFGGVRPGCNEIRAALLASRGYAAFALAYFGEEGLPDWLGIGTNPSVVLELEYFEEAVDWLSSQPYVQPGGVATIGICKGGEMALAMATHLHSKSPGEVPTWGSCVCKHQSHIFCSAGLSIVWPQGTVEYTDKNKFSNCQLKIRATVGISVKGTFSLCPTTYKGQTFPCSELHIQNIGTVEEVISRISFSTTGGIITRDLSIESDAVFQKFEDIRCPALIVCGEKDASVHNSNGQKIAEKIQTNGFSNECELVIYPGAGHLIEPPGAPLCIESYQPPWGLIHWGGIPADHAHAQAKAWVKLLAFLEHTMQENQPVPSSKL